MSRVYNFSAGPSMLPEPVLLVPELVVPFQLQPAHQRHAVFEV